jgi:hypothetical protein
MATADKRKAAASAQLHVRLAGDNDDAQRLGRLRQLVLHTPPGSDQIVLHAGPNGNNRPLKQAVSVTPQLRTQLKELFGDENVWEAQAAAL